MIHAICSEIELRKSYCENNLSTVYLGGGTPSVLNAGELSQLMEKVRSTFQLDADAEITIEVNPDDITEKYAAQLRQLGFNRVSVGIQSLDDDILKFLNRRHTAWQAEASISILKNAGFENINVDMIYGIPGLSNEAWSKNLERALSLPVQHLSAYHLTIEEKTVFGFYKRKKGLSEMDEEDSNQQFLILLNISEKHAFEQYEISNFARDERYSRHNTSYWMQQAYLGVGPSAHSYNGEQRSWNTSINSQYIENIEQGILPSETEILSVKDIHNDFILTRLRTKWGISVREYRERFGEQQTEIFMSMLKKHVEGGFVYLSDGNISLTTQGKFISDSLLADLFWVD